MAREKKPIPINIYFATLELFCVILDYIFTFTYFSCLLLNSCV